MTREELEATARLPTYAIVSAGTDCAVAQRTTESGATRLLGDGRLRLQRSACEMVLAEIHRAIEAGWSAGLAQALLALEDQPAEAAALARRAHRRRSSTAAPPTAPRNPWGAPAPPPDVCAVGVATRGLRAHRPSRPQSAAAASTAAPTGGTGASPRGPARER